MFHDALSRLKMTFAVKMKSIKACNCCYLNYDRPERDDCDKKAKIREVLALVQCYQYGKLEEELNDLSSISISDDYEQSSSFSSFGRLNLNNDVREIELVDQ